MSASQDPRDDALRAQVSAAQAGDAQAADELGEAVLKIAHGWFRRQRSPSPRPWEELVDLAQSVAVRFFQRLPQFSYQGRPQFIGYIHTHAAHLWTDRVRESKRHRNRDDSVARRDLVEHLGEPRTPPSVAYARETLARYAAACQELPQTEAELLQQINELGWSYEQAAAHWGVPVATVKRNYVRARSRVGARILERPEER